MKKSTLLKNFLYFGDMELSNPKLKKPYISEETCMAWKPKKVYISFHIQTQKKKVFYTFPYEETKFSKLKYFLIIKCFFSFYNFFSILNHFVFFILSDIFTTMLLLFFFFIFKKIFYLYINIFFCLYIYKSKLLSTRKLNFMYRNKWKNWMTMRTLYLNTTDFWCLFKCLYLTLLPLCFTYLTLSRLAS